MNCRLGSITSVPEELMEQVMLEAISQAHKEQEDNWEWHKRSRTSDSWPIHYLLELNDFSVDEEIAVGVVYGDKASDMVSNALCPKLTWGDVYGIVDRKLDCRLKEWWWMVWWMVWSKAGRQLQSISTGADSVEHHQDEGAPCPLSKFMDETELWGGEQLLLRLEQSFPSEEPQRVEGVGWWRPHDIHKANALFCQLELVQAGGQLARKHKQKLRAPCLFTLD